MTLETIKDSLKSEIRRELKIKEGAENLAKVAKDKRTRSELSSILKESNYKLQELHRQLNEVNAQVSDTGKRRLCTKRFSPDCYISGSERRFAMDVIVPGRPTAAWSGRGARFRVVSLGVGNVCTRWLSRYNRKSGDRA